MFINHLFRLSGYFAVFIIFFSGIFFTELYSQSSNEQILKKANAIYQKVERISIDSTRQVPSIVRGVLARNVNLEDDRQVRKILENSSEIFKINNQNDDFKTIRISKDKLGMTHLKLQQEYKGIPVWGSELILHASSSGELKEINGRFKPNLNLNVSPAISSERALEIALADLGPAQYRWLNPEQEESIKEVYKDDSRTWKPAPELVIAPEHGNFNDGEYHLIWKMTIAA
jgi:thermolysin